MSLEQAAPAPEAAAPASNEPVTSDDLVGMFKAELDAENAPAPEPKPQPEAPAQDEAAPEINSPEPSEEAAEAEQAEPSEVETATPAIDAPRGMSEADKAIYAQLPPEAKAWLAKREKDTTADYTRKTQEVAEQRKFVEAAQAKVMEQLQHYDGILSQFTDRPLAPPDPALRQTDPFGFDEQMANYQIAKHQQEVASKERERVNAEMSHRQQAAQRQFWAEQGQRLAEIAPELSGDTPKAKEYRKATFDYASKQGYTKETLDKATALDLVTLWKAQRFDAAMAQKAKTVVPPAPKVMQPGPARAAGRNNGFASSVRSLSENPTRASLAEAYRAELAAER